MRNQSWCTPLDIFNILNKIFHFDLDVAADDSNHLCDNYYTLKNDGLIQPWFGNVWCNPPFNNIYPWVEKAYKSNLNVCLLLPARTSSKWFHDFVLPYADLYFFKDRLRFSNSKSNAPFDCIIVIFKHDPLRL